MLTTLEVLLKPIKFFLYVNLAQIMISRKKNPDLYKSVSNYQAAMDARRDKRDKSGMVPKEAPVRGSYAEDRLNQLKKDREQYKVNQLGYYKDGIPQKDRTQSDIKTRKWSRDRDWLQKAEPLRDNRRRQNWSTVASNLY
jgi:hypothetical protein